MVSFDMEATGIKSTASNLDELAEASTGIANEGLRECAEDIKGDIEETAPVDTGEYKESWKIVEVHEGLILIASDAEHAKYVVFPNKQMRGVASADDPGRGILHNVRQIVKDHRSECREKFVEKFSGLTND